MEQRVRSAFREAARVLEAFAEACDVGLARFAALAAERLREGRKILVFGNGGSAADAQHLAAELVNRFRIDRPPLAALALTTDSSALTAIANDFGFEQVFEKQVRALARPGDVVIGITTSGASPNVLRGLAAARDLGCTCAGLAGEDGRRLRECCEFVFCVPSRETPRVQEAHAAWVHAFCDVIDATLFPEAAG